MINDNTLTTDDEIIPSFADFNISNNLTGERISINDILNKPVIVRGFVIRDSKYNGEPYVTIRVEYNKKFLIFTTSSKAIIERVGCIPEDCTKFRCTFQQRESSKGKYYIIE